MYLSLNNIFLPRLRLFSNKSLFLSDDIILYSQLGYVLPLLIKITSPLNSISVRRRSLLLSLPITLLFPPCSVRHPQSFPNCLQRRRLTPDPCHCQHPDAQDKMLIICSFPRITFSTVSTLWLLPPSSLPSQVVVVLSTFPPYDPPRCNLSKYILFRKRLVTCTVLRSLNIT